MFKFMKTKKGFSLVELMIVVVIMAILVAVAVPIYNSVTDNAKKGTCIDNQRQIMAIVGNDIMLNGYTAKTPLNKVLAFKVFADPTMQEAGGKNYVVVDDVAVKYGISEEKLKQLFQSIPCCGDDVGVISVYFIAEKQGDSVQVFPECSLASKEHIVVDDD